MRTAILIPAVVAAAVVVGGLIVSTLFTLLLVPALFSLTLTSQSPIRNSYCAVPAGADGLRLPIGLVRDDDGTVRKDPNQEVQERIELVFSTFLRLRAAAKVLCFCNEHSLRIPRHEKRWCV